MRRATILYPTLIALALFVATGGLMLNMASRIGGGLSWTSGALLVLTLLFAALAAKGAFGWIYYLTHTRMFSRRWDEVLLFLQRLSRTDVDPLFAKTLDALQEQIIIVRGTTLQKFDLPLPQAKLLHELIEFTKMMEEYPFRPDASECPDETATKAQWAVWDAETSRLDNAYLAASNAATQLLSELKELKDARVNA